MEELERVQPIGVVAEQEQERFPPVVSGVNGGERVAVGVGEERGQRCAAGRPGQVRGPAADLLLEVAAHVAEEGGTGRRASDGDRIAAGIHGGGSAESQGRIGPGGEDCAAHGEGLLVIGEHRPLGVAQRRAGPDRERRAGQDDGLVEAARSRSQAARAQRRLVGRDEHVVRHAAVSEHRDDGAELRLSAVGRQDQHPCLDRPGAIERHELAGRPIHRGDRHGGHRPLVRHDQEWRPDLVRLLGAPVRSGLAEAAEETAAEENDDPAEVDGGHRLRFAVDTVTS